MSTPVVRDMTMIPVAGHDSMLLNLSGAHGPFFTRNLVVLTDSGDITAIDTHWIWQDGRLADHRRDRTGSSTDASPCPGKPVAGRQARHGSDHRRTRAVSTLKGSGAATMRSPCNT
jgi:hypothetical protein